MTILVFASLFSADQGGADKADNPDPKLTAAIRKTVDLRNYSFTITENPGQGAGGKFQGKYQKGQPVAFTADNIEFYRQGNTLVYKDAGLWQRSKTGIQSDPLRILVGAAKVRSARLPHEDLAELSKHVQWDKKVEAGAEGTRVYAGTLDAAAARKMAPTAFQSVATGGQVKILVAGDGLVTHYALTLRLQGRLGNAEVNGAATRSVTFSELGSARVQVPDAARKALE
jgi:hypothetical protein